MPERDRFPVSTEHGEDGLLYDPSYFGIHRTDDVVFVGILRSTKSGRSDQKRRLCTRGSPNCWRRSQASVRTMCSSI